MDKEIPIESDAWNVAKGFSASHVLLPLIECRKLVTICLFGVEEIGTENQHTPEDLKQNRINAINRLLQGLLQICEDSEFIMNKSAGEKLKKIKENLLKIQDVIEGISESNFDQRINFTTIKINEKHFALCLKELREALSEIKVPLNMKNLIFPAGEDFDLDKIKEQLMQGG